MWRAPFRAKDEITQRYNDGVVDIFAPGADTAKARLRFDERRLGLTRAYEARLSKSEVVRVLRVPKGTAAISAQDTAVILGDATVYAIDMIQATQNVYPPSLDLTLKVAALAAQAGPHTVTVYNVRENPATFAVAVSITVLPSVLLEATDGAKEASGGLSPSGKAILHIPQNVAAKDAITGAPRNWAAPRAYAAADDEARAGLWTLDPNYDFFVKGEIVDQSGSFQALNQAHDGVYRCCQIAVHESEPEALWYIEAGGA